MPQVCTKPDGVAATLLRRAQPRVYCSMLPLQRPFSSSRT